MKIRINDNVHHCNCMWYCTEAGKTFDTSIFMIYGCYVVMIKNEMYLVHPNHCKIL